MNMLSSFEYLPDSADCWLYAADRELAEEEVSLLESLFSSFEKDWSSHGRRVRGACRVLEKRIVVVAAHIENGDISGCGIDKSLHLLQEVAESRSFNWASALNIVFQGQDEQIHIVPRGHFKQLALDGGIGVDTPVVDLSIRNLGALREHGLLRPVKKSWHFRLLPALEQSVS